jgi:hypothetical protein
MQRSELFVGDRLDAQVATLPLGRESAGADRSIGKRHAAMSRRSGVVGVIASGVISFLLAHMLHLYSQPPDVSSGSLRDRANIRPQPSRPG